MTIVNAALPEAQIADPGPIRLPDPDEAALFFDVDGTLVDICAHPGDVVADHELRALLSALSEHVGGALAFVSGRALDDIDRIFAPLVMPAAGLHGADIRYPDGSRRSASAHLMDHARPGVAQFVEAHPGLMMEDKGATIAVHFRKRPELAAAVLQFMSAFGPNDDIAIQEGKLVVELKPAVFDKGTAVTSMLALHPFEGRTPVFMGDDLTDELGFALVNARGGLSVRVGAGEHPTQARAALPDPAALRALLKRYVGGA